MKSKLTVSRYYNQSIGLSKSTVRVPRTGSFFEVTFWTKFFDRASKTCYKRVHMANGKTINATIDERALEKLAQTLAAFSAVSEALRKQIITLFPAKYGSDLWWEQSIERSKKDIDAGKYKAFDSAKDFVRYLDSIAP